MLTLKAGALSLEIDPENGAAMRNLTHEGAPVMRATPEDQTDALYCANFPLVPFCNRIKDAEFTYQGVKASRPTHG